MSCLDNWALVMDEPDPWTAPEMQKSKFRITGVISDHPFFVDGAKVTTSSITHLSEDLNTASTKNTEYTLLRPNEEWVKYLETIISPYIQAAQRKL